MTLSRRVQVRSVTRSPSWNESSRKEARLSKNRCLSNGSMSVMSMKTVNNRGRRATVVVCGAWFNGSDGVATGKGADSYAAKFVMT